MTDRLHLSLRTQQPHQGAVAFGAGESGGVSWANAAVTALTDLNARRHTYTGIFAHLGKKPQLPTSQTVTTRLHHDGLLGLGAICMRGLPDQQDCARGVVIVVMAQAVPLEDVQNLGNEAAYARRYHDRSKGAIASS